MSLLSSLRNALAGLLAGPSPSSAPPPDPLSQDLKRQQIASERAQTELRAAQAAKERQQTEEARAKTVATYVDTLRKLVPAVAITYGLIATFLYFYGSIQFFPSGLTVGDTVLFIFVALGFGLFALLFVGAGCFHLLPGVSYQQGVKWASPDLQRPDAALGWILIMAGCPVLASLVLWSLTSAYPALLQSEPCFWVHGLMASILGILAVRQPWRHGARERKPAWGAGWGDWGFTGLVYGFFNLFILPWAVVLLPLVAPVAAMLSLIAAMLVWIALDAMQPLPPRLPPEAADPAHGARSSLIGAGICALLALAAPLWGDLTQFDAKLSAAVFRSLGLRMEGATVKLKGDSLHLVRAQAKTSGIHLNTCLEPDGTTLVSPVNVLWHGMGKRSWLSIGRLPARNVTPTDARGAEIEVAADELKVLRSTSTVCHDLRAEVFFSSKSSELDKAAADAQAEALRQLLSAQGALPPALSASATQAWRLEKVLVTGQADGMPLSDNGNEALARKRAACLAKHLQDRVLAVNGKDGPSPLRPMDAYDLTWTGTGARQPAKTDCPWQGPHDALVECHAVNRVATVRVILACQKLVPDAGQPADVAKFVWVSASNCPQGQPAPLADDRAPPRRLAASAEAALKAAAERRAEVADTALVACTASSGPKKPGLDK